MGIKLKLSDFFIERKQHDTSSIGSWEIKPDGQPHVHEYYKISNMPNSRIGIYYHKDHKEKIDMLFFYDDFIKKDKCVFRSKTKYQYVLESISIDREIIIFNSTRKFNVKYEF